MPKWVYRLYAYISKQEKSHSKSNSAPSESWKRELKPKKETKEIKIGTNININTNIKTIEKYFSIVLYKRQ